MTILAPAEPATPATSTATTSTSPTARVLGRRLRGPALVIGGLLLVAVILTLIEGPSHVGYLDTTSSSHEGSHAVAVLLRDQGVPVRQVRTVDAAAATSGGTLVVAGPDLLPRAAAARIAASGARTVVLVGATDDTAVGVFAPGASVLRSTGIGVRQPDCGLPAAATAGAADGGGATYALAPTARLDGIAPTVERCYPVGGDPSLLVLSTPSRTVVLLGADEPLLNGGLARQGNASLVLNLLGSDPAGVTWYLPSLDDLYGSGGSAHGADQPASLVDLLPDGIDFSLIWLVVVVLLLVAWRARRLGAVVPEALPVVVRASETIEGRARLYRRGRTRGRAAELLREATRDRLTGGLGMPPDTGPEALVEPVAAQAALSPAEVSALLYGAAPPDDASLVRLACELEELEARTLDRRSGHRDRTR